MTKGVNERLLSLLIVLYYVGIFGHLCKCASLFEADITDRMSQGSNHHEIRKRSEKSFYMRQNWVTGVVSYEISSQFDGEERQKILDAMEDISQKSCVRFKQHHEDGPSHYLHIYKNDGVGCLTETLRNEGEQRMTLDPSWCLEHGRILHELMHALGFSHEHQRPDRDDYIEIMWNNIKEDQKRQFIKENYPLDWIADFQYDLTSVMHYANWSNHAAINTKKPIILPKVYEPNMGQRKGLNGFDIEKLNILYKCNE